MFVDFVIFFVFNFSEANIVECKALVTKQGKNYFYRAIEKLFDNVQNSKYCGTTPENIFDLFDWVLG